MFRHLAMAQVQYNIYARIHKEHVRRRVHTHTQPTYIRRKKIIWHPDVTIIYVLLPWASISMRPWNVGNLISIPPPRRFTVSCSWYCYCSSLLLIWTRETLSLRNTCDNSRAAITHLYIPSAASSSCDCRHQFERMMASTIKVGKRTKIKIARHQKVPHKVNGFRYVCAHIHTNWVTDAVNDTPSLDRSRSLCTHYIHGVIIVFIIKLIIVFNKTYEIYIAITISLILLRDVKLCLMHFFLLSCILLWLHWQYTVFERAFL